MKDLKEKNALFQASHLMILITYTVLSVALTAEAFLMGWEKWALILIGVAVAFCWYLHIQQIFTDTHRLAVYVGCMMGTTFFYGTHLTSLFDLGLLICGTIILCTTTGNKHFVTACQVTYYVCFIYDIVTVIVQTPEVFDSLYISRTALHVMLVFVIGFLAKIIIDRWIDVLDHSKREVDKLTETSERLNDFMTSLSHEIRTPINAVRGLSGICLERTDDPEQKKDLQSISSAGRRMTELISEILDYSDIARNSVVVNTEDYMLSSVLHDLVQELAPYMHKGVELIIDVDPAIPAVMNTDVYKLKKILWHLITNALKFTEKGGVYVRATSEQREYGLNLFFEISDTGIGMTTEEVDSLFEGENRADSRGTRAKGGLGLGMAIVRGFVASLGGFVPMESRPGEGTTVRVSLPQKVVDASSCMSIKNREQILIGGYLNFEKYDNPVVREYYNTMVINIVRGLGVRMHRVDNLENLQKLLETIKLTHLFIGEEEYRSDSSYMEQLARSLTVTVIADSRFALPSGSKVHIMEKPFYCFPVAVVLNREQGDRSEELYMYCRGIRALIVDDEPLNITVAKDILRRYGITTKSASSGEEAIKICSHETFDIIFMDHMMPGMDGIETMRRIRSSGFGAAKSVPIVALTANAGSTARETFRAVGFDGFVAKPIDFEELEHVMRLLLPKSAITYEETPHARTEKHEKALPDAAPAAEAGDANDPYAPMKAFGVNVQQGLMYCRNDDDFYRELLQQFASEADAKRAELDKLFADGDLPGYSIRIHALKSTAKMIGASGLSDKAKALEEASKNGQADAVKAGHHDAMDEYNGLKKSIFSALGTEPAGETDGGGNVGDGAIEFAPENEDAPLEFDPEKKEG